jgi:hypothetical protein
MEKCTGIPACGVYDRAAEKAGRGETINDLIIPTGTGIPAAISLCTAPLL